MSTAVVVTCYAANQQYGRHVTQITLWKTTLRGKQGRIKLRIRGTVRNEADIFLACTAVTLYSLHT